MKYHKHSIQKSTIAALTIATLLLIAAASNAETPLLGWTSTLDGTHQLAPLTDIEIKKRPGRGATVLGVDIHTTYQTIEGLGSSLEPTTCANLARLPEAERREAIRKLVHPVDGINMNLMRICIGTPDFTGDPWYSYCDPPDGEPDPELKHFSIEKDKAYILPVLKMALEENPDLKFFASP